VAQLYSWTFGCLFAAASYDSQGYDRSVLCCWLTFSHVLVPSPWHGSHRGDCFQQLHGCHAAVVLVAQRPLLPTDLLLLQRLPSHGLCLQIHYLAMPVVQLRWPATGVHAITKLRWVTWSIRSRTESSATQVLSVLSFHFHFSYVRLSRLHKYKTWEHILWTLYYLT
jgi:hypothetical protein